MSRFRLFGRTLATLITLGMTQIFASALAAAPNEPPSNAELFVLIQSLQSRVAALETEAARYKKEAEAAKVALNRVAGRSELQGGWSQPLLLASPETDHPVSQYRPVSASAEATIAPQWSGLYLGGSFGGGWTESQINSKETYASNFPTNSYPFQTETISSIAKSSGHGTGAAMDLFAGFDQQFGRRLLGGLQVEGSIADLGFDSDGKRSLVYSNDAGPTGETAVGPFRPHLYARWMVSALARGGFLVSPTTLAYGLVGWTGAQFEYENVTDNLFYQPEDRFWANGITFGGGVEQKLAPNWSLRAEYRYTDFSDVSVGNNFLWSSNFPSTQANTIRTKFNEDMQMVRIGVAYLVR